MLPRWAAVVCALGLALWCPIFPRPVRLLDGVLIGIGGAVLARGLWRGARGARRVEARHQAETRRGAVADLSR